MMLKKMILAVPFIAMSVPALSAGQPAGGDIVDIALTQASVGDFRLGK